MNKMTVLLISLISFFCAGQEVHAQLDSLSKDDVIRITAPKYFIQPAVATFERQHSDSLFIIMNNRTSAIPFKHLQKLELSTGEKHSTVEGIIIGSIAGGLILGIAMHSEELHAEGYGKIGQPGFVGGFVSGILIGGGIGALIGNQIKSDEWKHIAVDKKNVAFYDDK